MEGMHFEKPNLQGLSPHESEMRRMNGRLLDVLLDGIDSGTIDMTREQAIQQVTDVADDAPSIMGLLDRYGGEEFKLHGR